jgi:hypothetical protein
MRLRRVPPRIYRPAPGEGCFTLLLVGAGIVIYLKLLIAAWG